ncbi:MAG: helix-turn-helix transcriptional regulator [Lachnospiraceae bacterium]|nr:helix-turn-helix transcriptional regulator [Lachnospiraceae bacterium]
MGIRNAGAIIKEARLKAGMTQEQLSEGICSLNSLSFIETNRFGVSSSTFQALMAKAGSPCEAYPIFRNRNEFDAFINLKNARLYADNWCLSLAYQELMHLKDSEYGNNRLYYQEALYLYCRTMYLTYTADYNHILDTLIMAVRVSHPSFDLDSFDSHYLSSLDFEIIVLMANVYLNMGDSEKALNICKKLDAFLKRSISRDRYYAHLDMLLCYTLSKYYFTTRNTALAKEYSEKTRTLSVDYFIYPLKIEIFLLDKINDFMNDKTSLTPEFSYAMAAASHLECGFLPKLTAILKDIGVPAEYIPDTLPKQCGFEKFSFDLDPDTLSSGSFDIIGKDVLTIGSLIGELRTNQAVSMRKLCEGLCSVSKLSKIENRSQEPSVYLAEALLNRLGYSERDFLFYGNDKESEFSSAKNNLISLTIRGEAASDSIDKDVELCLESGEPLIRQLGLLFGNIKDPTSSEERNNLFEGLNITIPDFNADNFSSYRLTWAEITLLSNIIVSYIRSNDLEDANVLNDKLYEYSKNSFIMPGYKNIALISPVKNRLRILYNMGEYKRLTEDFNSIDDEFLSKNFNLAGDLFFYSSQSFGELKDFESMRKHAETGAGYFTIIGNTKRCNYLLNEIKNDFGITI